MVAGAQGAQQQGSGYGAWGMVSGVYRDVVRTEQNGLERLSHKYYLL